MLSARRLLSLGALLLCAGFVFGLVRLLALRYSTGDVFAPYSSLRADPLGAQVFYESLRALPGLEVQRSERDLDRVLGDGANTTLLVLGVRSAFLSEKEQTALRHFIETGGRVVVTYFPSYEVRGKKSSPTPTASPSPSPSAEPEPTPRGISLEQFFDDVKLKSDKREKDNIATRRAELPLEETLSWHSGISFHPENDQWRTVYEAKRGPVIVERQFGAGSVVLAADSFFISNEGLLTERAPALLAWLVGPARRVIFDETHLNIHEQPGVATLLRRYGLSGFAAGLLLFIFLWAWRNSTAVLAPRRALPPDAIVTGRDSFAGFVHLLRRGIAPSQLLEVCVSEWKKSAPRAVDIASAGTDRDPVAQYNRITDLLTARKWKRSSSN